MIELPAGLNKEILEIMVGRYGFALRIGNYKGGRRSTWWLLRPDLEYSDGPWGTRQKARKILDKPNWDGERKWGIEAAKEAIGLDLPK